MKKKPTSLRRSMFMRLGFNFYDVAVTIFCVAFGLLCFYPLWYCLVASVMPYEEYVKGGLMLWFKGIDLQYYIQIFSTKVYTNSLLVSAVKTVLATALSVLVTSAMAYAVSKVHIRGMKLINALVVFNLFFAGGLIPQYMLYKSLHLTGNFWVMVLPGTLNISYFIIMRNYFSFSVSRELEDAAMIDGAYGYGDGRCKYVWFSYMFSGVEYYCDFENQSWWDAVSHPVDFSNSWATEEDAALVSKAKDTISGFVNEVVQPLPAYYNMVALPAEATDIINQLATITNEYLTQFIGGQLDIDASWGDYAAAYEAAGAAELETMINDAVATARTTYRG